MYCSFEINTCVLCFWVSDKRDLQTLELMFLIFLQFIEKLKQNDLTCNIGNTFSTSMSTGTTQSVVYFKFE